MAWPRVIPMSSTVWCASTCRSPRAWMSRSSMPCRATWSSMWSRNGMPVAREAFPAPSTLTDSAICVSAVLRSALAARVDIAASFRRIAYTKSTLGERFSERRETAAVLLGSADREPHAPVEERHSGIQVLDEDAPPAHAFEHARGVGHTHQDEIRLARKDGRPGKPAKVRVETLPFADDALRLSVEHVVVRENPLGDRV